MVNKDSINKIAGTTSLVILSTILFGYVTDNDSLLGFSNAMMLYVLMPSVLIWFGTRRNGCGSCNQTYSISESKQNKNIKNDTQI
jgi:hypothetical protein